MNAGTARAQFTEAELKLLQTLVYQECGMYFDERRAHFLQEIERAESHSVDPRPSPDELLFQGEPNSRRPPSPQL